MRDQLFQHARAAEAWSDYYGSRQSRRRTWAGMPNRRRITVAPRVFLHATKGKRKAEAAAGIPFNMSKQHSTGPGVKSHPKCLALTTAERAYLRAGTSERRRAGA